MLALQHGAGNAATLAVQRADAASSAARPSDAELAACSEQERALSREFGIRIGPSPTEASPHFDRAMLARIGAALRQLPIEDLRDNDYLVAIENETAPTADESRYSTQTASVRVVQPRVVGSVRAGQRIHSAMSTDPAWERQRMDDALMSGYAGVTPEGDEALGIPKGSRGVLAPQGNLVKWTTRHEVGHAVDLMTGWQQVIGEERFGGWRRHRANQLGPLAETILHAARLDTVLASAGTASVVTALATAIDPATVRAHLTDGTVDRCFQPFEGQLAEEELAQRRSRAIRFVRMAAAQPWTLEDGGARDLSVDGRIYHVSPSAMWVSYLQAQRQQYKVSNYQYSEPREWFAEAYSAYYNSNRPELRRHIHPQAQQWLATHAT